MAYVSLYRKYRPQSFEDVVGQAHVIRTLVNAIEDDRLHHAYLFTGPRGTGKTSTARLLAKAINCEQGPTAKPCQTCEQCTAIAAGTAVDVIELDMASHGGVDDARELRDRALFAPASARRKVYILDEVHMASTAAFNALLKLIEEPPGHVLFAMATTDPQKVLPTILSRVQRLDLRRVSADDVAGNVRRICEAEGYTIEDEAVEAVVRAGDGSLRDTQSILEQVLAFSGGDPSGGGHSAGDTTGGDAQNGAGRVVTAAAVAQVLGHTPAERVFEAVDRLAQRDVAGLFALVQGLLDDGHDLRRFTLDLVQHARDLLVLQVAPDRPDLVDATDDRRRRLQAQTTALPQEALLRAVDLLAQTVAEQRQGSPRLPLELALATLAVPGTSGDLAELADRISRLEQGASPATSAAPARQDPARQDPARQEPAPITVPEVPPDPPRAAPAPTSEAAPAPQPEAAGDPDVPTAGSAPEVTAEPPAPAPAPPDPSGGRTGLDAVVAAWEPVLELVKRRSRRSHAVYEPATPVALARNILTLRYPARYASFHAQNAGKGEYVEVLREALERTCGIRPRVDAVVEGDDRRRPVPPMVTPDDARTPVLDPQPREEEAEVREAEMSTAAVVDELDTDELLSRELGARLLDEEPPREG